jgi:hypothetical protein
MAALRCKPLLWYAAALLSFSVGAWVGPIHAEAQILPATPEAADQVDNLKELFARLLSCWRPPPRASALIDITVLVSFDRSGNILGHPKITYESEQATDDDRLLYRVAVMEALQRCTPMPFTEGMAGATAGRPFAVLFKTRRRQPKPIEKRAWLLQKIL